MKFWDIVWIVVIAISISSACLYSNIKGPIVLILVIGGYFIYGLRKSIFLILAEIEELKSEKKK